MSCQYMYRASRWHEHYHFIHQPHDIIKYPLKDELRGNG